MRLIQINPTIDIDERNQVESCPRFGHQMLVL